MPKKMPKKSTVLRTGDRVRPASDDPDQRDRRGVVSGCSRKGVVCIAWDNGDVTEVTRRGHICPGDIEDSSNVDVICVRDGRTRWGRLRARQHLADAYAGKLDRVPAHWSESLVALGACTDAVTWARTQPSADVAWLACGRGDWLLWLLGRTGADRPALVLAACDCAEPALVHVLAGEDRPRLAIETARRWARGESTIEEVRAAVAAAYAAAAYAAAYAAYAAAAAAYAVAAAAAAAAADADAAYAADAYAADADARSRSLARSADLVRARFPTPPPLRAPGPRVACNQP